MRQKFDWWEDVENDITKNTKALAGGTNIPTTDTKNLGTACTGPATAIKLVYILTSVLRSWELNPFETNNSHII